MLFIMATKRRGPPLAVSFCLSLCFMTTITPHVNVIPELLSLATSLSASLFRVFVHVTPHKRDEDGTENHGIFAAPIRNDVCVRLVIRVRGGKDDSNFRRSDPSPTHASSPLSLCILARKARCCCNLYYLIGSELLSPVDLSHQSVFCFDCSCFSSVTVHPDEL